MGLGDLDGAHVQGRGSPPQRTSVTTAWQCCRAARETPFPQSKVPRATTPPVLARGDCQPVFPYVDSIAPTHPLRLPLRQPLPPLPSGRDNPGTIRRDSATKRPQPPPLPSSDRPADVRFAGPLSTRRHDQFVKTVDAFPATVRHRLPRGHRVTHTRSQADCLGQAESLPEHELLRGPEGSESLAGVPAASGYPRYRVQATSADAS